MRTTSTCLTHEQAFARISRMFQRSFEIPRHKVSRTEAEDIMITKALKNLAELTANPSACREPAICRTRITPRLEPFSTNSIFDSEMAHAQSGGPPDLLRLSNEREARLEAVRRQVVNARMRREQALEAAKVFQLSILVQRQARSTFLASSSSRATAKNKNPLLQRRRRRNESSLRVRA